MSNVMLTILSIGIGGFCGASLRHFLAKKHNNSSKSIIPKGTLFANLIACILLGILTAHTNMNPYMRILLITGLCGSLSTYSTFILELKKVNENDRKRMWHYLGISIVGGILLFYVGINIKLV